MKFLVFQHSEGEHPRKLGEYLEENGIGRDTVRLDLGESAPPSGPYGALLVMGGVMNVWETDEYPWLADEKRAIRKWVLEDGKPYFGVCLGHQLLAEALGGSCERRQADAVGVADVELTREGVSDPLYLGASARTKVVQWHGVDVAAPPPGATVLAKSPGCAIEAMRAAARAWSVQYHVEADEGMVPHWIASNPEAAERVMGSDGCRAFARAAAASMDELVSNSRTLFSNFISEARAAEREQDCPKIG